MRRLDPTPEVSSENDCDIETFDLSGYLYEYAVCGSYSSLTATNGFNRHAENDIVYRYTVGVDRLQMSFSTLTRMASWTR